jgi:predicted metal-dependent peptidase
MTAQMQTQWDRMTARQRITAVNVDIMNHKQFSALSGAVMMGSVEVDAPIPTAGTNGKDIFYGEAFALAQTRKQLRYVHIHEALHIGLRHCTDYADIAAKYPNEANQAMDYVVNGFIEQTDPTFAFVERPTAPTPLVDPKYFGRSFVDVLQDLLRNKQGQAQQTLDTHMPAPAEADLDELRQEVQDAMNHGEMVQKRLAGADGKCDVLSGFGVNRETDWRSALREWVEEISAGDEHSRYNPPNRRFLPLDIIMPSHFDIAAGEMHIYCDTSGSMAGVYPVIFGEISNICKQTNPTLVRIIWWDTRVRGEQTFVQGQYDSIAQQLAPKGGGGTTPQCVVQHVQSKHYKPSGAIWLTDGYIDACPTSVCSKELWGVINNDRFKPAHGKTLRIYS